MENHRVVAKRYQLCAAQLNSLIDDVQAQRTVPPWLPEWLR